MKILLANNVAKFSVTEGVLDLRDVTGPCVWDGVGAVGRGSTRSKAVPCRRVKELIVTAIAIGILIVDLGAGIVNWI
jgi:hypothetical protein